MLKGLAGLCAVIVLALSPALPVMAQGAGAEPSVERFYSLPRLIGTAPQAPAWRGDSRAVAYLWNDSGYDFRDIWLYSLDTATHSRLTDLAAPDERQRENARGVSELAWAGSELLFVRDGDIFRRARTGEITRLTDSAQAERQITVLPGGQAFVFLRAGNMWLRGPGNGERRLYAPPMERQFVEDYQLSPDGTRLAVIHADDSNVPFREIPYHAKGEDRVHALTRAFPGDQTRRRRVGILDIASGEMRWLEHPAENPIYSMQWSASGAALMVDSSTFFLGERTIRTYDTASGAATVFWREEEPRQVNPAWSAAWAPGDDGLIVLSDREGWYHLWHKRSARSAPKALTKGEWEVASFDVDAAGGFIYFLANRDHPGERQHYRVPFGGGAVEKVGKMPGTHAPVYAPDFRHAADIVSDDMTPPDLYLTKLFDGLDERRLTTSPLAEISDYSWAEVRYPTFKSHVDGAGLVARVTLPADFDPEKRYPLIVGSVYSDSVRRQWGGRNSHPVWGLDQVLASRGYILMTVNVAGSFGQGKAFRQRLLSGYGGIDIDDLESGVRHLVAQGYVDPGRVGIWGSSYGGLMTLMSLFKKPGLYAAGVAGAPASNVWHAYPEQMWALGHSVHDNYERYAAQAAQHHTAGLEDALMIIHGNADVVVLYGDTLDLADRLIHDGKSFELVTLPGSSHAWDVDNLTQTRFAFHKMIDFFDRHLKPGGGESE